jgi:3'-phosphoadenosine 5'-phosphosulfate sulfotransferase (PAPS reductase)/FAD synthetase
VFCDTGWENPITYQHIHETTKALGVKLVQIKSEKYDGLVDLSFKKKRFPSTNARFCTDELKAKPAIDYVLSQTDNVIVIEGIRGDESLSRSKMEPACTYFKYYFHPRPNGKTHSYRKKNVVEWTKKYNADKVRPIFDWTAEQTVSFILENGQKPNPLYYMGFSRVGCFPCIMARKGEVKLIIENHPEQWQRLKDAEDEIGRSFFPPNYIPKHACNNGQYPMVTDVEKYIKGKNQTLDMFADEEPIKCMSVYNLCE